MKNIAPRPGMFEWHTPECDLELREETHKQRRWWCYTHNQWAYEVPISVRVTYTDGTSYLKVYGAKFEKLSTP